MSFDFSKMRILFVDDETELLEIYADAFVGRVRDIFKATNAIDALDMIKSIPFDVIVSDISMPKMSGIELLEEVRRLGYTMPFIIVTGFGDKENAIRALKAGAFDFLEKPISTNILKETTERALMVGEQIKFYQFRQESTTTTINATASKPDKSKSKN